jgi:hypothetical protein
MALGAVAIYTGCAHLGIALLTDLVVLFVNLALAQCIAVARVALSFLADQLRVLEVVVDGGIGGRYRTFGQNASKAIGDYGASKTAPVDQARAYQDLKGKESAGNLSPAEQTRLASMEQNGYTPDKAQAALNNPQNQADYANWKEGGPARVAAHTIVGGLTGGTNGAFGAATSQTVVPLLGEQLASLDIPADLKKGIILAAGLSIGVATGGVGGGRCSRRWSASGRPLAWAR